MAVTEDALLANPALAALLQKPYPPSIQYPRASGGQVTTGPVQTSGPVAGGGTPYSPRWLDFGLQMEGAGGFKVPTFSASDLAWNEGGLPAGYAGPLQYATSGDQTDYSKPTAYWVDTGGDAGGYWQGVPQAGVRWADNANRDAYSWFSKAAPGSNSVELVSDPNNPNGFALQIKTADKQGTLIPYALQGNEWVPQQQGIRQFGWDTNDDFGGLNGAAYVLGAAGLGALLAPSATGAAGAAPAGSVAPSAADIAAMGNVGMGAGGAVVPTAEVAAAGGGAGALGGLGGVEPIATSGFSTAAGGTGSAGLGAGYGSAGVVAGEASGALAAPAVTAGGASGLGGAARTVLDFAKANPGLVTSGISALIGGTSVPGPSGTTQNAAAGATNVADRYLQLADQQWLWQQQMEPQFAQTYQQLLDATLADAAKQRERGDALWTDYTNIYRPLMEKSAADAMNYDNPAEVERRAGIAAATVAGQFDAAQGAAARERARAGVSSASGRGAASELAYSKAGATAGAVNNERINAMLTGIALRRDQAGLGRSTEQAGLARDTAAMTAGKAAEGTMGNQVLTRNAMLSPRLQALMGANAAYGTASGIGNSEWAQRYQQQADRAGLWSQFGGAAARWLVDQFG